MAARASTPCSCAMASTSACPTPWSGPCQLGQVPEINPVLLLQQYAERWTTYRLGPKYPESYEGTRFDADKYDAFIKSGHDA